MSPIPGRDAPAAAPVATAPAAATAHRAKIVMSGVVKTFASRAGPVPVLAGIDLEVREGEFVAIVGPSGCGKSTLLNCLAGFESIDAGAIVVDGAPLRGPSLKRVFVFQEPAIFPWLTVEENIGFGLSPRLPASQRSEIVARYVALVGLGGFERAHPGELSGGMKQRVEFARALAVEAEVLYLDEPFGSLDAFTRLEMRREIVRIWNATKKTCILVTHDVEEACELADRIAVMAQRPATMREVLENPLPRPRDPDAAEFRRLKQRLFEILGVERRV